ncbi:MAG: ATP-binding protein [Nanoarchaeota archaeon]|nr:ATP-binding protein [Nanoarchaeota archaeon]
MAKRIVITGASGTGKSSIIEMIHDKGFCVEHEIARELIDDLRRYGHKNPHKENRDSFQKEVLHRQLEREKKLIDFEGIVFFDRGIIDNIAYYRLDEMEPPGYLKNLARDIRYDYIFYLEPISKDKLQNRNLNDKERIYVGQLILNEYLRYGYNPIKVPELTPDERINMIFTKLCL